MKTSPYTISGPISITPIFHAYRSTGLAPFTKNFTKSWPALCYSVVLIATLITNELANWYSICLSLNAGLRIYTMLPRGLHHFTATASCLVAIRASLNLGPVVKRLVDSLNRVDAALFKPMSNPFDYFRKILWMQIAGAYGIIGMDLFAFFLAMQFVSPNVDVKFYSTPFPIALGNALVLVICMFVVIQYVGVVIVVRSRYDAVNRHLGSLLEDADLQVNPDLLLEKKIPRDDLFSFDLSSETGRRAMITTMKSAHQELGDICVEINASLGFGAFLAAARFLFSFVAGCYNLTVFLTLSTSPLSVQLIVSEVLRLLVDVASLVAMALSGERVGTAAKRTALAAQQCLFVEDVDEMQEFVDQMAMERVDFSASLLKVNMQMIMKVVATVTTYAVVWFSLPSPTEKI